MTSTTPPRPVDPVAVFPELAPLARTATRLHPRPGTPSPHDSSIGGPLLWPANEPWPHCDGDDHGPLLFPAVSLVDAQLQRRIDVASKDRAYTTEERELLAGIEELDEPEEPIAMLPVAQLYARDVPGLPAPEGADLLQVLWCPFEHDDIMPKTALFWRSAAAVTDLLLDPPKPAAVASVNYVPEPCALDPEQIIEYPEFLELEAELRQRLNQWNMAHFPGIEDRGLAYLDQPYDSLAIAPGWKVGGWINWGLNDPFPNPCSTCGTPTKPLLTIDSTEWHPDHPHWIPADNQPNISDAPHNNRTPTQIRIADNNCQIIRVCPTSPDHPHIQMMQ
ncbi:hypothetical protein [Nocardia sp. NPDC050175]|uniref:hypothetical protein n=1 Tax=Nocardia sp. NPDC050175 TaxID=3364317 RepID=UPI00379702D0